MEGKLILASASPRRRELLERAGIPFRVEVADVPEIWRQGERGVDYVRRLAQAKARAVDGPVVLAADTTVEIDGEILEKPVDPVDAYRMISRLSGRWHEVHTGICLRAGDQEVVDQATTRVRLAAIPEPERQWYAHCGEPMGKAGGYAIQGLASRFVERIEGCYFNVVGLPVSLVWHHLRALGA